MDFDALIKTNVSKRAVQPILRNTVRNISKILGDVCDRPENMPTYSYILNIDYNINITSRNHALIPKIVFMITIFHNF